MEVGTDEGRDVRGRDTGREGGRGTKGPREWGRDGEGR